MSDYELVTTVLSSRYEQVNGYDFYKDIFPNNEITGELNTNFSKPNAIYLYKDIDTGKMKRRIMLNDTWEDDYVNYIECNPMTLCGGLSYRGRTNKLENAQRMHALIFDLDGVGEKELEPRAYQGYTKNEYIAEIKGLSFEERIEKAEDMIEEQRWERSRDYEIEL